MDQQIYGGTDGEQCEMNKLPFCQIYFNLSNAMTHQDEIALHT